MLSPSGRVLVHPFRAYASLREEPPTIAGGARRLLFVVGVFVATTATGRLVPIEIVVAMGSFAWVPLAQLFAVAAAVRAVTRRVPLRTAFALHLAGQAPAMTVLLAIAVLALVVPADATAKTLLRAVPALLCVALGWGAVVRYACFRRGLELSAGRAALATAVYTAILVAVILLYFASMGQLLPLFA